MKRLITKIQKLQAKYGFNSITDLYENCPEISFGHNYVTNFDTDGVTVYSQDFGYNDFAYNELPKETLEQIFEAFKTTILEIEKYESVQHYSNI